MATFLSREVCPTVKNILLLDSEGKRVAVKYFSDDWPTNSAKLAFEKSVFTKTQKTNARTESEITMLENNIIVYRFVQDLHFFVTGGDDENELILATVLQGFFDAVTLILRNNVEQREALENLDLILLCLDEIVDGGMILETDGSWHKKIMLRRVYRLILLRYGIDLYDQSASPVLRYGIDQEAFYHTVDFVYFNELAGEGIRNTYLSTCTQKSTASFPASNSSEGGRVILVQHWLVEEDDMKLLLELLKNVAEGARI
ncbi:coatomer subunit zeta-1-like [Olea europaea subsp. europaea]|uniref:Coatomer subunit zeta n=1 Tax=Olea europaea subsp. europaea TaxID=158383 RepID=A0A8S0QHR7_OLEEU|nr:coatomer subunit zeta-1-like [Olea europaea subsp. europaea]